MNSKHKEKPKYLLQIERLKDSLKKYGFHTDECDIHGRTRGSFLRCDCGWELLQSEEKLNDLPHR